MADGEHDTSLIKSEHENMAGTDKEFLHQHTASRYSQSDIVTLLVGPEVKQFHVHSNLLRQKSRSFRAALSGQWRKDTGNELIMKEEDPDVVETMIDWIYHGTLPKLTGVKLDFNLCLMCYKFAETRMMYAMKNTIMDILRKDYVQHGYMAEASAAQKAYLLDLGETQMGRFLVKSTVYKMMKKSAEDCNEWENGLTEACEDSELAKDIVKEIMAYNRNPYSPPYQSPGCHFHDHSDGGTCSP